MYEKFFNLTTKPFELVPNPNFLYLSSTHKKAMAHLEYAVKESAGFILFTGEVGSGKTTLIKDLTKKFGQKVVFASIFNTRVTSEQLIAMINEDFGLPLWGMNKVRMVKSLYKFLIEKYSAGYQAVLIIDEAQNLKPEILEEIRLLSNLATENARLLNIILVGQPELRDIVSLSSLRQLRQRITVRYHLNPLDRNETEEYILHRLDKAGNRNAMSFSANAIDLIHQHSGGIPRLINVICDYLFLYAFVEEQREVHAEMVQGIVKDLELKEDLGVLKGPVAKDLPVNVDAGHKGVCLEEIALQLRTMNDRLDLLQKESSLGNPIALSGIGKRLDILEGVIREQSEKNGVSLAKNALFLAEIKKVVKGSVKSEHNTTGNMSAWSSQFGEGKDTTASLSKEKVNRTKKGLLRRIFS